MRGFLVNLGSFLGRTLVTAGSGPPPGNSFLLLADGSSFLLLADGSSKLILA